MAKARILVVEDENIISLEIQERLKIMGHAVCGAATTAEEAISKAADMHPDLVLMDIMLRGSQDGIEAAGQIKDRLPVPIIYLTAYADDQTLERARSTEPYGYLIKPFEDRELHAAIEMALYKHKAETIIRESEQRYAATIRCIADGVIVTDINGLVTLMNPVAQKLTGWSQEQAAGKHLTEVYALLSEDSRRIVDDLALAAIKTGRTVSLEHPTILISRDGHEIPVDDSVAPILDGKGKTTGVVVGFRDVTLQRHAEKSLRAAKETLEARVQEKTADLAKVNQALQNEIAERKKAGTELEESLKRVEKIMENTIRTMSLVVEARDRYTAGHQRRVTQLACAIAQEMKLSDEQTRTLRIAGLLHDLGKINIPTEILSKPGRLTEIEFAMIKTHPQAGYEIVKTIDFPPPTAEIVLQHHERIDGSGYCAGLKGPEILLEARILAVSDVVEAMSSHRPYRPALGIDKALQEILDNRGILYDADVVDACLTVFRKRGFRFED
jgi:PAS domain S-box-containing protein/putative nucleotidyltransferase with HDIG domain